ncbi:hypothetical protein PRIPAC_70940 [Pristionchus pacificus]|uniref:Uncharacterized protein n=1 Tax=Pristionchus pacificus TaxID=54126 RepID=A0A2A6C1A3_PRIPA|nr:hypothetical protein PRIPAC_70940 [Pristionchus pacificus]|eukprot:PDM71811.1 hypothetical protein PRIPAC_38218 [Pristionchus pacificus]
MDWSPDAFASNPMRTSATTRSLRPSIERVMNESRAVDVKNEFCLFILTHKGPRRDVILHEER